MHQCYAIVKRTPQKNCLQTDTIYWQLVGTLTGEANLHSGYGRITC